MTASLPERLRLLEEQVARLTTRLAVLESPRDWRSTISMFAGDEEMKRVFEAGRRIRAADRRKARPPKRQQAGP